MPPGIYSRPLKSMLGLRFYKLLIIGDGWRDPAPVSKRWVRVLCDCGNEFDVLHTSLKTGNTKSCGCLNRELSGARLRGFLTTHGQWGTRLHKTWIGIRERCRDKKNKDYGGRGIRVCQEWQSFENFYRWAVVSGYNDSLTIDRIDVNGNYEPSNCRWVTIKAQQRNKRNTLMVTYHGQTKPLKEWAEELKIPYMTLWQRLKKLGQPTEIAFTGGRKVQKTGLKVFRDRSEK